MNWKNAFCSQKSRNTCPSYLDLQLSHFSRLLEYDGTNPELYAKMYQILAKMIERKVVPSDLLVEGREPLFQLTMNFFDAVEKEKGLLKGRIYSTSALSHVSNVLSSIVRHPLELSNSIFPLFRSICDKDESLSFPSLHIDFITLLLSKKDGFQELVQYVQSRKSSFATSLHWLMAARSSLKQAPSTIPTTILSLSLGLQICYIVFEKLGHTEMDATRIEIVESMLLEVRTSNSRLADDDSLDAILIQDWVYFRQEVLASVSVFQGLAAFSSLDLPLEEDDKVTVIACINSLFRGLSYIPDAKSPFSPWRRQATSLAHLKRLFYCLDFDGKRDVVYNSTFLPTSNTSGESLLDSILLPNLLSFKLVERVKKLDDFREYIKIVELLDRPETFLMAMKEPGTSLKEVIDWMTWNASLESNTVFKSLEFLFAVLPKNHLGFAKNDSVPLKPKTSFKFDLNSTPCISDLHSFLCLVLLERQLSCIERFDPAKAVEYWASTAFWTPSAQCSLFWGSCLTKYSSFKKTAGVEFGNLVLSKTILLGVQDLRCESKYCENYGSLFGLLGLLLFKLCRKGNQLCLVSAKFYLDFARRASTTSSSTIARRPDSMLNSSVFDRVASIMQLDALARRVDDDGTAVSMDLDQLLQRSDSTIHSSAFNLKKRVSFEVSKSNELLNEIQNAPPFTPQMKTNSLPGFFPNTPPVVVTSAAENEAPRPSATSATSLMNTPQLLKSVPGFYPQSSLKKKSTMTGILKQPSQTDGLV